MKFRTDIKVELIQSMGSDEMVARAARCSTGKDQVPVSDISGLIGYLSREEHTSPFEHLAATVRVEAPISMVRQWERHRTMSYSELSLRFSEATPEFYIPPADRPLVNEGSGAHPKLVPGTDWQYREMSAARVRVAEAAWSAYQDQIKIGIANEVARDVLPFNIYSTFYATANFVNWQRFLKLRNGEKGAPQSEIVTGALQVQRILTGLFPMSSEEWRKA